MSWIQQNKFLTALIAVTVILCAGLLYFGSKGSARYQELLVDFRDAEAQVSNYERLQLYPNQENLDGKTQALANYEESIATLKSGFEKFQTPTPERISPQAFSDKLVATNERATQLLRAANIELPDGFYSGFEGYTTGLAQSGATPVLVQQLETVEVILADLTTARPSELINFRREPQPEEAGRKYEPRQGGIVRPHSFEITFRGTEASARRFITSLANTSERFVIVRTVRIRNEKGDAPQSSSTQFTAPAAAAAAPANPFEGGFFGAFDGFAGDDDDAAEEVADDADEAPAPAPSAAEPRGARMLAQVAGSELLEVFIRFDVANFLPQAAGDANDES